MRKAQQRVAHRPPHAPRLEAGTLERLRDLAHLARGIEARVGLVGGARGRPSSASRVEDVAQRVAAQPGAKGEHEIDARLLRPPAPVKIAPAFASWRPPPS